MTKAQTPPATPAGWYPEPTGLPLQRWWDGSRWTEHLHDPSLEVYGATAKPIVGAGTPVYNVYIWLVVALPLVSVARLLTYDMRGAVLGSRVGPSLIFDPGYLLSTLLSWSLYLGTVAVAFFDWRKLTRDGFVRPFHWAFAFITPAVYAIGRSVIVNRRAGRGLAPLWACVAVIAISLVVTIVKVSEAMSAVLQSMPGLTS